MQNKFRIAIRKFDPFEIAIEKIWKSFCVETECNMELEVVPMDLPPLHEATLGKENGLKTGTWDISHINTDWIAEADQKDCLEDLTPWINVHPPDNYPEGWSDSLLNMQKLDHRILALPFHDGPECLIYRKDLFNEPNEKAAFKIKYNRELQPPSNWEELYEVAHFFHRPEQNLYGTAFALYPDGHNTVFDFSLQLWSRGGELVNKNGLIEINTPIAEESLRFYRKIVRDKTVMHPGCVGFDSVKLGMAFANGEVAMMVNWFGFASMCELYSKSKIRGCVDIADVPAGIDGCSVSLNVYWLYAIGKGSKHKELAYDFIRFAINAKNDKLLTLEGGIGCRKSTWSDMEVNEMVPYYHKLDVLHNSARTLPRKSNWNEISHVIDQMVIELLTSDSSEKDLLNRAQVKINEIEKSE